MRAYDVIKKKRDGGKLSDEEIRFFIEGMCEGRIPDYQVSALCMAILFRGMDGEETASLTLAIRDSGEVLSGEDFDGVRVDKHSTGGVGDKTSLIVTPIAASLGLTVAKMSGRGLGHTGGTVDKLEAIPGFRTELSHAEFVRCVRETGASIVGQSRELAPADKRLYALRDVTATVDSLPLIASSIMGKKLAANDDCIVLDVKTGSGAFMKTLAESRALAEAMADIGARAGKRVAALITDMDAPLGYAIGNALEVHEAVEVLRGRGPEDLRLLCEELAAYMVSLGKNCALDAAREQVRTSLASGRALDAFVRMVEAQGGDVNYITSHEKLLAAPCKKEVYPPVERGYIVRMDTEACGVASLLLGAGRERMEDVIDPWAGIYLHAKTGDAVRAEVPMATLYTSDPARLEKAEAMLLSACVFGNEAPPPRTLIYECVERELRSYDRLRRV